MKAAYLKLHISIILAGFTGILGKLISLNEGLLVWYRLFFSFVFFLAILWIKGSLTKIKTTEFLKISSVGILLAAHWLFFYASIKYSNVSIGVVCLCLNGFFTAVLEPFFNKRSISYKELLFSFIGLAGIVLIFHVDLAYFKGIVFGIISSLIAALFVIANKKLSQTQYHTSSLFLYQLAGGLIILSCFMPFYMDSTGRPFIFPAGSDLFYMIVFALICTIGLYILQLEALNKISAFTVNLSYNLEPIYSIILAVIIFHENDILNLSFCCGFGLIIISVLLQSFRFNRVKGQRTKESVA